MLVEIEKILFVEGPDKKGKNPVYCLNSLDCNYFRCVIKFFLLMRINCSTTLVYMLCFNYLILPFIRTAGEVMAASLAQGGPCPNFLREWCFRYLCSGDSDSIQVSASDVTDFELSQLIVKVSPILSQSIIVLTSL